MAAAFRHFGRAVPVCSTWHTRLSQSQVSPGNSKNRMCMLDRSRLPRIFLEGLGIGITRPWWCPSAEAWSNNGGCDARETRKTEEHTTFSSWPHRLLRAALPKSSAIIQGCFGDYPDRQSVSQSSEE